MAQATKKMPPWLTKFKKTDEKVDKKMRAKEKPKDKKKKTAKDVKMPKKVK